MSNRSTNTTRESSVAIIVLTAGARFHVIASSVRE
jgi:hypothetical protein